MSVSWFFKDNSERKQKITREDERRILAQFKEWSPRILAVPEVQKIVTFDEVIGFLKSDVPGELTVSKGVVVRQDHPEGQVLGEIFIDKNNHIVRRKDGTPYGRQLVAKKLDKKLTRTFGNSSFIFVDIEEKEPPEHGFERDVFAQFGDLLRDLLKLTEVVPLMTYEEAIKYFVTDRPKDPRIKKGAILRKSHLQGHHLVQMFLDKNNKLVCGLDGKPYGRQLVARELDEELQECFGDKDLIILV